ncbi:riboflavin synthase subunit beta [Tenacibaculum agarivorans]|uniref:riboflavin synthase subunit beta n=1 Tax=Tenacibaculum agarivorans TaxID=1908389 RepID=UPI00094BC178|nr:riboflavin synthase subunit beta [Tenacibaculum agarivorans]
MGIFKKQHKKFEYKPRYYKGEGNPYEFKHKFDEYRTTVGKRKSIKDKIFTAVDEFKSSEYGGLNKTIVIIAAILTLIFLYLIDFDLSIFLRKR